MGSPPVGDVNVPQHWTWRAGPVREPGMCAVVDIDGVLADAGHRQHHLEPPWRDWDSFFADAGDDGVFVETVTMLDLLGADVTVALLTSRPTWIHRITVEWLHRQRIRWDLLIMRPPADWQPSPGFKRDELFRLQDFGFDTVLAIDDDPRNVRMYRAEDIPTLFLESGYHPH